MKYKTIGKYSAVRVVGAVNQTQFSERVKAILVSNDQPRPVICIAYYAFIFSLPFEEVDVGLERFSLSKMVGYALFAATLLQPRVCFRFPPKAFWCFAIYVSVYGILALDMLLHVQEPQLAGVISRLFTLVQLLIIFWLSYNLMRDDEVIKGTVLTLSMSCSLLALLQLSGISSDVLDQGQVSAFGGNPNALGVLLSLGLLALAGLAYGQQQADLRFRLLFWLCGGTLTIAIVQTGSRGATLALVASLLVFFLQGRSLGSKIKIGVVAVIAIGFLSWVSYQVEPVRERWERTFFMADVGGREEFSAVGWEMFLEKPLIGWGPEQHLFELGSRLGTRVRDPHNIYLWILEETGLLGAIPFFAGVWLCWRAAWKARLASQGVLPLSMLLYFLVTGMKGTWHTGKLFWVVLAFALVSNSRVALRSRWPSLGGVYPKQHLRAANSHKTE